MATPASPYPTLPAASPAVLWREYHRTGDVRLRDRLVFTLAPLIRHTSAAGTTPDAAERGLTALLHAIDAYRPERDGRLERFAFLRVDAALRV
ncbi:MAG TPA: hypothetical protein VN238_11465 [Solirubrobacteraceae bacterium]|nr:hypothetical protein [Solirubrobacteraceae bacterium]